MFYLKLHDRFDLTLFNGHNSTSSYRLVVNDSTWSKGAVQALEFIDRFRCIAEVHPAPNQTSNLKSPSVKINRRPKTDFELTVLGTDSSKPAVVNAMVQPPLWHAPSSEELIGYFFYNGPSPLAVVFV